MRIRVPAAWPASRGEATTSVDEADARAVRRTRLGRGRDLARRGRPRLPQRAAPAAAHGSRAARFGRRRGRLRARMREFFAGKDDDFLDVPLVVPDGFYGDCARVLRAVPRGEVVTYGELASLAGFPGAARAAGTFCGRCELSPFVPDAPRRRLERHRLLRRPRRRLQAPAAGARGRVALMAWPTTSGTSWRRSRRCAAAAGWPRSPRSSTPPVPGTCGAAASPCTSTSASSAAARRAFALLRDLGVRSEIRTYRRRAFDQATRYQLHVDVDAAGARVAARGGRALVVGRAARACRRSASSAAPAAAAPTCAARCSAPARSPARAIRISSCGRASVEAAPLHRRRRRARRACACPSPSGATTRSPTRRATRRSATCWRRRRGRHGASPRGACRRRRDARERQPARERRRGEPRAHGARRAPSSSRRSARSTSTRCRRRSPRSPSCGCATRRRRCASSRRRRGRRSRRPPRTAGCGRSSRWPRPAT